MALTTPAIYRPAPPVVPARFGLFDAASVIPETDPHFRGGVEFEENPCGPAKLSAADCAPSPSTARTVGDGVKLSTAEPIVVYNGFTCRSVGWTEQEILDRAEASLTLGESTAVERAVWGDSAMRLMDPTDTFVISGTAVPLVKGIGLLEEYLGENYGGQGIIHAPRLVAAHAGYRTQIRWDGGKPVTQLGNRWAFGNYPNTNTAGAEAAADTAWLVGTSQVVVRRSQVAHRPVNYGQALDSTTNEFYALAERTYVVAWECVTAAVLVTVA